MINVSPVNSAHNIDPEFFSACRQHLRAEPYANNRAECLCVKCG